MSDLTPEQMAMQQSQLLRGEGWRVGRRPQDPPYTALVGSETWALELTEAEWQDLGRGLQQLQADLQAAQAHLMEEESITLEHQTERLTLIATGFPHHYQLYLQLHSGRRGEGQWPAEVIPEFKAAVERLMPMENSSIEGDDRRSLRSLFKA